MHLLRSCQTTITLAATCCLATIAGLPARRVVLAVGAVAPVQAAGDGTVELTGPGAGHGLLVAIGHTGRPSSYYGHLSRIDVVVVDQRVETGQRIALSGATGEAIGPHLHFELRLRGAAVTPIPALR